VGKTSHFLALNISISKTVGDKSEVTSTSFQFQYLSNFAVVSFLFSIYRVRLHLVLDPSATEWRCRHQPESSGAIAAEEQTARRRASRNYRLPPQFLRRAK